MISLSDLKEEAKYMSRWEQHRFLFMVTGAIVVSLILVAISMNLYNNNGTAQVDLSRPGYQAVRDQVSRSDNIESFSSTGELDEDAFKKFEKLYAERSDMVLDVAGFGSAALSDDALQIFSETGATLIE